MVCPRCLQFQHFLIVGDDIVEVILGSVHLGNLTPISLEVVFQLGHPAVQVGDFLDVTKMMVPAAPMTS